MTCIVNAKRLLTVCNSFSSLQTQVDAGVCMTDDIIHDALGKLRGAVTIVYPMGLPPHDPIRLEFEGNEDLSGTQVRHTLYCTCRWSRGASCS